MLCILPGKGSIKSNQSIIVYALTSCRINSHGNEYKLGFRHNNLRLTEYATNINAHWKSSNHCWDGVYAQYNSSLCELGKRQLPSSSYKSIYRQYLFKETARLYNTYTARDCACAVVHAVEVCGFRKSIEHAARAAECKNAQTAKFQRCNVYSPRKHFTQKIYMCLQNEQKLEFRAYEGNFDSHFQIGYDIP